jgi:hypothetical protein
VAAASVSAFWPYRVFLAARILYGSQPGEERGHLSTIGTRISLWAFLGRLCRRHTCLIRRQTLFYSLSARSFARRKSTGSRPGVRVRRGTGLQDDKDKIRRRRGPWQPSNFEGCGKGRICSGGFEEKCRLLAKRNGGFRFFRGESSPQLKSR